MRARAPRRSGSVATPHTPEQARPFPPNHCVKGNSAAVGDDPVVHVGAADVVQREGLRARERGFQREVQRGREDAGDLFAVCLGWDANVGRHRGQTHGVPPHFGHPSS